MKYQIIITSFLLISIFLGQQSYQNNLRSLKNPKSSYPTQELIQNLFERLKTQQYSGDSQFGLQFTKGLYASSVKLNIITDSPTKNLFGDLAFVPDDNMFVTNFVVNALIMCKNFGTVDFQEEYLEPAIDALLGFRDKNIPQGVPIYSFWEQILVDDVWVCQPENLFVARDYLASLPKWMQNLIKKWFGVSADLINEFASVFRIPADNDDTGINIALGSILKQNENQYPNLNKKWDQVNIDYTQSYNTIKKYLYQPYSDNFDNNSIDPRSYFYIQGFLNQTEANAQEQGIKPDLNLFATWLTNISDQKYGYERMPFSMNNVDLTVNTNSLYGILSFILVTGDIDQIQEVYDDLMKKVINNVTDFIVWGIESEIVLERPDLSLTYYPSIYNFYYFVSRIAHFLNGFKNIQFPEIQRTKEKLNEVLKNYATQQLLDLRQEDNQGNIYWESFLGNYHDKNLHTDLAFSTAMAINSLYDIYTVQKGQNKLQYIEDTPQEVKDTIDNSIQFLTKLLSDQATPLGNTFFSGSVKTSEDLPFWYPANAAYMYNIITKEKKYYNPSEPKQNTSQNDDPKVDYDIYSFSGTVSPEEYQTMVWDYTWSGEDTPTEFAGFNQEGSFPYWTSDSITLSFSMLCFSKYLNIEN